ncbi:MAG: SET domain-containing protein-lysine N-methyltransferase [Caldilineaceae bacterium]|nr:SET domain-containing protein-lysine N-methyltransferase [Caldilineaceae bacterium]
MLYVREIEGKGRGVFTQGRIHSGALIERAPVIILPAREWDQIERTVLFNYCYGWGEDSAMALGLGSLYNHSYQPNAIYTRNFAEQVIEYTALRDIEADEEITVNYNCDPTNQDPLWFAVR